MDRVYRYHSLSSQLYTSNYFCHMTSFTPLCHLSLGPFFSFLPASLSRIFQAFLFVLLSKPVRTATAGYIMYLLCYTPCLLNAQLLLSYNLLLFSFVICLFKNPKCYLQHEKHMLHHYKKYHHKNNVQNNSCFVRTGHFVAKCV